MQDMGRNIHAAINFSQGTFCKFNCQFIANYVNLFMLT